MTEINVSILDIKAMAAALVTDSIDSDVIHVMETFSVDKPTAELVLQRLQEARVTVEWDDDHGAEPRELPSEEYDQSMPDGYYDDGDDDHYGVWCEMCRDHH